MVRQHAKSATSPSHGLDLLEELSAKSVLERYAPLHLAHADMLRRLERFEEARERYRRALEYADNEQVRRFIERRLAGKP